jgi:hypothetical protein
MHWQEPGKHNTEETVQMAVQAAADAGIQHIVVASNSGQTAALLKGCGLNVTCVTHQIGFREAGQDEMTEDMRRDLIQSGFRVLTTSHLFANIERAATNRFGGLYVGGITSHTLRMLGQGVKVCTEISVMALDAGMIPYGEDVVAVAGTNGGADTSLIIRPAHSQDFFSTEIREIVCKPRKR